MDVETCVKVEVTRKDGSTSDRRAQKGRSARCLTMLKVERSTSCRMWRLEKRDSRRCGKTLIVCTWDFRHMFYCSPCVRMPRVDIRRVSERMFIFQSTYQNPTSPKSITSTCLCHPPLPSTTDTVHSTAKHEQESLVSLTYRT